VRKLVNIILSILVFAKANAQTGIGVIAPVNKFDIFAVKADPATSGSTANGNLRLGATVGTHVLDFGLSSSSTYGWLQTRDRLAYGTYYNLAINPNGGQVGIGSTSTISTLTVGNTSGTIAGELTLNPSSTQYEGGQINIRKSVLGSTADWIIDQYGTSSSDARLRIFNSIAEANGIAILENGNIGMGLTNPTVRLQVNGDIIANSIAGSSDIRFKKNIRPVENALDKVKALRGVYFKWNQEAFSDKNFGAQDELGFIAQEVEKVVPEIVTKENTKDEYRSVKYDKLVALLVEAIKEQQKQIDSLEQKVNLLSKKRRGKQ
jgi:hypothetical protein